jgi:hypothetical protein
MSDVTSAFNIETMSGFNVFSTSVPDHISTLIQRHFAIWELPFSMSGMPAEKR